MKPVGTATEPECFATWRAANPAATWAKFKDENRDPVGGGVGCNSEVLNRLVAAQRGLCAFCEIDLIEPLSLWAQVEHWHPKDPNRYPGHNWGLDFSNFMAGCEGGERDKPPTDPKRSIPPIRETRHCGAAKGNDDLTAVMLDPRKDLPHDRPIWTFDAEGHLGVAPDLDPALAQRAEKTRAALNLDSRTLRRLRGILWEELTNDVLAVWGELGLTDDAYDDARAAVTGEKLNPQSNGHLRSFWSTIRSYFGDLAERWVAEHPEVFQ